MPFTFKLSARLARIRRTALILRLALVFTGCEAVAPSESSSPGSGRSPASVSDLSIIAMTDSSATLAFSEVDDGHGRPASYRVRYARTSQPWDSAVAATRGSCGAQMPGTAIGARRTCTVEDLDENTSYTFAVTSYSATSTTETQSNVTNGGTAKRIPPRPVTDLAVSSVTDSSVFLSFTEVDDGTGKPASYEIRYSNGAITWDVATVVAAPSTCAAPLAGTAIGARRTCSVLRLAASRSYSFQMVAYRGPLGSKRTAYSSPSNIAVATTLAPAVGSVLVNPSAVTVLPGETAQLSVTILTTEGSTVSGPPVTWASSDTVVATVSSTGMVRGMHVGTAMIRATAEGETGEAPVAVMSSTTPTFPPPGAVTDLVATATSPSSVSLSFTEVNDGTGQPANYDVRFALSSIQWGSASSVSNGTCSTTVDGTTIGARRTCSVLGLNASSAYQFQVAAFRGVINTADAVFGPVSNVASATTSAEPPIPVASVTLTPSSVSGYVGQSVQLSATLRDANGYTLTGRSITWASTNSTVATVSSSGLVSEVGAGSATITATSEGQSGGSQFTVNLVPVASVTVSPSSVTGTVGQTIQLSATLRDANGNVLTGRTVTWSSNNTAVASVSTGGLVSEVSAGSATITAASGGRTGTSQFTVNAPALPPPPPPPGGTDEPVDPGSSYLWADDFDRYESTQMMQACQPAVYGLRTSPNNSNCNDPVASKFQLTTGRSGTGRALRSVYAPDPQHLQQSLAWLSPWGGTVTFGNSIVISFWVRIGVGQSYAPFGGKFFEAWWVSGDSRRIQWSNSGSLFEVALGANPGGTVNRTQQVIGPRWENINDGQWHRVTLLFKANSWSTYVRTSGTSSATESYTGSSSRDGRVAMWIDGTKIIDYSQATVGVTPSGGTGPWCRQGDVDMIPAVQVHHFQFPEVANGTDGGMTMDHDDLKVWRGN